MATKEKESKPEVLEYDMTSEQRVEFQIEKNGRTYKVAHLLRPVSNARFSQLEAKKEEAQKNKKYGTVAVLRPTAELWDELIIGREGYTPTDDYRGKTNMMDKIHCMLTYFHARPMAHSEIEQDHRSDAEIIDEVVLFDEDEATCVTLETVWNGRVIEVQHFFKAETQAQMDEYISILADTKSTRSMTTGLKEDKTARVVALYDEVCESHSGYKEGTAVPDWHKVPAVMNFFGTQFERM